MEVEPRFPGSTDCSMSLYWLRYLGMCNFACVWSCEHCEPCAYYLPSRFETGGFLWLNTVSWRCVLCKELADYLSIPHLGGRWRTVRRRASSSWVCTKREIAQKCIGCKSGFMRRRRQKSSFSPSQLPSSDLQPNFLLTAPHTSTPWSNKSVYLLYPSWPD